MGRKEISKLKKENQALKRQLSPMSSHINNVANASANIGYDALEMDIMQRRVMDRLDQNHRILRYLHEWSDNLPLQMLKNANSEWMHRNVDMIGAAGNASSNTFLGISLFHILLIIMLTLCLVFWDTNNIHSNDADIFNASLQFCSELYLLARQFIPESLHVYEDVIFEFTQDAINQTSTLTQIIIAAIN